MAQTLCLAKAQSRHWPSVHSQLPRAANKIFQLLNFVIVGSSCHTPSVPGPCTWSSSINTFSLQLEQDHS